MHILVTEDIKGDTTRMKDLQDTLNENNKMTTDIVS